MPERPNPYGKLDRDAWQGATDSGQGPAADPGLEGIPTYPNHMDEELGTELILTLPPEVLAQLQRIEDMLAKVCKSTHICPSCGNHNCPWEDDA